MKKHATAWVKNLAKYGIGFGLLAYILWKYWEPQGSSPGIKGLLDQTPDLPAFAGVLVLLGLTTCLMYVRWFYLVRALDLPFTVRNAFRLGLVGSFYNAFLPGSVGGDLVKAYFVARGQPKRRAAAVSTVIADRLVGLFGLIWFAAALGGAFWLAGDQRIAENDYLKGIIRVCAGLVAATVVVWALLGFLSPHRADRFAERLTRLPIPVFSLLGRVPGRLLPRRLLPRRWGDRLTGWAGRFSTRMVSLGERVGHSLAEVWDAVRTYRQRPRVIYALIGLTAVAHVSMVFSFHLAVRVFPAPDPATLAEHFIVGPVGFIAQAFFPAPGGVGGAEAIFGYLYTLLGRAEATGVVGRLAFRVVEWTIGLVGYILFLRMRAELPIEEAEDAEEGDGEAEEPGRNGAKAELGSGSKTAPAA